MNEPRSIKIVENMQKMLLHLRHPNLAEYAAIAVEEEIPLIKFLVLEEYMKDRTYISLR